MSENAQIYREIKSQKILETCSLTLSENELVLFALGPATPLAPHTVAALSSYPDPAGDIVGEIFEMFEMREWMSALLFLG